MTVRFTRRRFALAAGAAAAAPSAFAAEEIPNLGAIAATKGIAYGAAFGEELFGTHFAADSSDHKALAAIAARQVRIVATETPLHFSWLRSDAHSVNFGPADQVAGFARRIGAPLRGSIVIWTDALPDWLKAASNRERRAVFDRHIDEVVGRYAGQWSSIDGCNEPTFPDQWGGPYRPGPWLEAFGPGYIGRAFQRMHAIDPNARLVLNEAFCEQADEIGASVRKNYLRLLDDLLAAGAPVSAAGFQGHLKPYAPYDDAQFRDFLFQVAERGVPIYITEFDVDDRGVEGHTTARDALVAQRCRDFLTAILEVPAVRQVINWGLSDRFSWLVREPAQLNGRTLGDPRPLPFDAAYNPKPALYAMAEAFAGAKPR